MIRHLIILMVSAQSILGLTACSGGSGELSGMALGGSSKNNGNSKGDDGSGDDNEKKKANAPQQVAGSFLTCAYWDTTQNVARAANADQPIEVGCGLFKQTNGAMNLTDVSGFELKTSIVCNDGMPQKAPAALLKSGAPLQFETSITAQQFACMVELGVTGTDGARATFGKSVPTITQVNAQNGFNIYQDMKVSGVSVGAGNKPVYPGATVTGSQQFQAIMQLVDVGISGPAKKKLSTANLISDGGEVPTPPASSDTAQTQIQAGLTRRVTTDESTDSSTGSKTGAAASTSGNGAAANGSNPGAAGSSNAAGPSANDPNGDVNGAKGATKAAGK